jgi:hypothetical protein
MADLDVRLGIGPAPAVVPDAAAAARAQLRAQIAGLERQLSEALIACLPYADGAGAAAPAAPPPGPVRGPRVLDLGELERVRDALAARLAAARADLRRRAEHAERARLRLEYMRLQPGRHRFARVTCAELGEGSCGVWHVRPRFGLLGMLAGWWELKLSSGCPLSPPPRPVSPRRRRAVPLRAHGASQPQARDAHRGLGGPLAARGRRSVAARCAADAPRAPG